MFNDKYGLTQAVLEGRKTQTRRIITCPKEFRGEYVAGFYVCKKAANDIVTKICLYDADERPFDEGQILPKYKVGETIAVAQSYKDCGYSESALDINPKDYRVARGTLGNSKGWNNKMFVRSEGCIHQIRTINIRAERLQDISDEDCLAEGVVVNEPKIKGGAKMYYPCKYLESCAKRVGWGRVFHTPREAFANLIDKVSGEGTWERNPWVWVYEFELVK